MTYESYMETFIWKYLGLEPPKYKNKKGKSSSNSLFELSSTLLSGMSVYPKFPAVSGKDFKIDIPVWVVFMNRMVEIEYKVKWTSGW